MTSTQGTGQPPLASGVAAVGVPGLPKAQAIMSKGEGAATVQPGVGGVCT